jgi:hypothetical protein
MSEFNPSSTQNKGRNSVYEGTIEPKIKCKTNNKKALKTVPRAQSITGRKKTSRKNAPLKRPVIAPVRVRIRQLRPSGAEDIKSSNNPEKNPDTCPVIVPFVYAENITIHRAKSGTAP